MFQDFLSEDHKTIDEAEKNENVNPSPPQTYEEFLKEEDIDIWPQRLVPEEHLDLAEFGTWTFDDLKAEIKQDCEIGMKPFNNIKLRFDDLEDRLEVFSSSIFEKDETKMKEGSAGSLEKSRHGKDEPSYLAVKLHQMDLRAADKNLSDRIKRIERVKFPGYRTRELTELPSQLEALQLLNKVTEAQTFNKGFKQVWKALFFSQASIALLHDSFWWIFMKKFQENQQVQDHLFSRIADNYVALFASIHPDIRDKFLNEYPRCLAQAIFVTFFEGFSESREYFTNDFAMEIYDITAEWITGLPSSGQPYKEWHWDRLLTREIDEVAETLQRQESLSFKLDFPSMGASKDELSGNQLSKLVVSTTGKKKQQPQAAKPTKLTKLTVNFSEKSEASTTTTNLELVPIELIPSYRKPPDKKRSTTTTPAAVSERLFPSDPNPIVAKTLQFERVNFDTRGLTPLVSHHLYMKQLLHRDKIQRTIVRSETTAAGSIPLKTQYEQSGVTLSDVVKTSKVTIEQVQAERKRLKEETDAEIERVQKTLTKSVKELNQKIASLSDPMEVKLMCDQLIDYLPENNPSSGYERSPAKKKPLKIKNHDRGSYSDKKSKMS